MSRTATGRMYNLAEKFPVVLRVFHHRSETGFGGVQTCEYPSQADWIAMDEVISLVEAYHLAPAAENGWKVEPGYRTNVYFANSIKYR